MNKKRIGLGMNLLPLKIMIREIAKPKKLCQWWISS